MKKKSASIHEVARRANVSIATVSRVVNGNYYVGPEITKRVTKAIEELDYQPNFIARSLKGASSLTIAFLVSDISNSYFNFVARAIETVVSPLGYSLIVCSTEGLADRELSSLKTLLSKRVDGFIVNATGYNDQYLAIASQTVPTVLLHRRLHCEGFMGDFVDSDNRRGAHALAGYLLDRGHRLLGVISGPTELSSGQERLQGFCEAAALRGVSIRPGDPHIYEGDFTAESGFRGMQYFRESGPAVTGLAIMNNAMTVGALQYLREHQVRVPEEISIVSYGDIINRDIMYVRPTIVTLDPRAIGQRAAELLISRIADPHSEAREFIYSPALLPGDSVAAPSGKDDVSPRSGKGPQSGKSEQAGSGCR